MSSLHVELYKRLLHSVYSSEPYGPWEETWENTLGNVYKSDRLIWNTERVDVDYEPKVGDIVYVLWVEYSSGNSFGRGVRNYTDMIHVFKDNDKAWEAYRLLKDSEDHNYSVTYETDTGKQVPYYRPWLGYFDQLDEIHVEERIVE
jgi:hypothetical protein